MSCHLSYQDPSTCAVPAPAAQPSVPSSALQVRISGGTNIAYAITRAAQLLKEGEGEGEGGSRTLVLLTDGRVDGYQVGGGRGTRGGGGLQASGPVCSEWLQQVCTAAAKLCCVAACEAWSLACWRLAAAGALQPACAA